MLEIKEKYMMTLINKNKFDNSQALIHKGPLNNFYFIHNVA